MKRLLLCVLIGFLFGAMFFSCAGPRALTTDHETTAPEAAYTMVYDTLGGAGKVLPKDTTRAVLTVVPHRTLLDKVLGRQPEPKAYRTAGPLVVNAGKKSVIYSNSGPGQQTVSTAAKNAAAGPGATSAAKSEAPVAGAGATSQDFTKQNKGGGAAANGAGSTATATVQKKGFPWAAVGIVAGIIGVYCLVLGGGMPALGLLWAWVKRKASNSNQA